MRIYLTLPLRIIAPFRKDLINLLIEGPRMIPDLPELHKLFWNTETFREIQAK